MTYTGICGVSDANILTPLLHTTSHLLALHTAVSDTNADAMQAEWALILEEDIVLPFDIDYAALIATAPADASVLQLMCPDISATRTMWWVRILLYYCFSFFSCY